MIDFNEKEQQQALLENYKIDMKEYMDLVIEHMPKFKTNVKKVLPIALLTILAGYVIPAIEAIYIKLFLYCLFILPISLSLNTSFHGILKWDHIVQSKAKGHINYFTIQEDTYKKGNVFRLNKFFVEILFTGITLYIWVIQSNFLSTCIFTVGILIVLLYGQHSQLKARFFFFTRDELLNNEQRKER